MKMELIDKILQRMSKALNTEQLQELKAAMIIALDSVQIIEEHTELSTEVLDNGDYARKYLQALLIAGKSEGTIRQYALHIRMLFDDIRKPIQDITDDDLMTHLAKQKFSRNLSNRYLNNKRKAFRSFFGWLRRKKLIPEDPAILLDQIKYDSTIKKPYSDEEREKIRCSCSQERDLALVDMLYSTAARVSEIEKLNRADIDFVESGCIVHGKGGKERTVYLNATAAYHLQTYLQTRTDDNPALFVSSRKPHNRLTANGIRQILHKLGNLAGVANVHPHRYRRTALTNASNRGMPLQDVQMLAGHANPNTTMIYCTVDKDKVKAEHKMYLAA